MPKDQTRNIVRYKVSGGHLNEFEFHKHQGEMREQLEHGGDSASTNRPSRAERVAQVIAEAHRKVEKKKKRVASEETKSLDSKQTSSGKVGAKGVAKKRRTKKAAS